MGHEIVYCSRCQSRLTSVDIEKGLAVRNAFLTCCVACLSPEEREALREKPKGPTVRRPSSSASHREVGEAPPRRRPVLLLAGGGGALLVVIVVLAVVLSGGKPPPEPLVVAPTPPPREAPKKEVEPIDTAKDEFKAHLAAARFREAQALLDRRPDLRGLDRELYERARARVKALSAGDVKAARAEIAGWGPAFEFLAEEIEASRPPAPPPPTPPPATVKAAPVATAADLAWEKALGLAARRDYAGAIAALKAAGEDVADLERLQALQPELPKALVGLPAWEEVALTVRREDGSRAAIRGRVLQAGEKRLELRGDPRFVEHEDVAPSSLAKLHAKRKGPLPAEDARALALLCAIDGDAAGARELDGKVSERALAFAATARAPEEPERNEWSARKLYYEAEVEFAPMETRGAAMEKYKRLTETYGDTRFLRRNGAEVAARLESSRDYVFSAPRLKGQGIFGLQKAGVGKKEKTELLVWLGRADATVEDAGNYVEAVFHAVPGLEYKAWVLAGGCCAATFSWVLQASELTYPDRKTRKPLACEPGGSYAAPWEHKLRGLSTTHGGKDHAKAAKEASVWEWADLALPKYAAGGAKTIRLIGSGKGMAVAAVVVSAVRAKKPGDEELKGLAEEDVDEPVPTRELRTGPGAPDLLAQIPEARAYLLVYELDLANLKRPVKYDVDQCALVTKPFDRVAYLVELQAAGGVLQYVFVSMDAFTGDVAKTGIPDANDARFQQAVDGLNVHSNVEGVSTGILLEGGRIEFWPNNYAPGNALKVPGAADDVFDFGDQITNPVQGYGCMQVHNAKAGHTIFAINHWSQGGGADLGIGNGPGKNKDWTFTANAKSYGLKRLRVLVRPKG